MDHRPKEVRTDAIVALADLVARGSVRRLVSTPLAVLGALKDAWFPPVPSAQAGECKASLTIYSTRGRGVMGVQRKPPVDHRRIA